VDPALEALLKTERSLWRGRDQYYTRKTLSSGYAALDRRLPAGGWSLGVLTELLVEHQGIGEFSLLLPALSKITTAQQWVALINPPYVPYAPALTNAGLDLDYLLIVDTGNNKDTLWSAEQLLRSGTFQGVILWLDPGKDNQQINRLRRLQLAAEQTGVWAVAYQHDCMTFRHSPAALRIRLQPASANNQSTAKPNAGLSLELIKVRGGTTGHLIIPAPDFDSLQGIEWPGHTVPVDIQPD